MNAEQFLRSVTAALDALEGTHAQKMRAKVAAEEISQQGDRMVAVAGPAFLAYLYDGGHRREPEPISRHINLPQSVIEKDGDDLLDEKALEKVLAKRRSIAKVRIRRCREHLSEGWPQSDCLSFVCSQREWEEALFLANKMEEMV